MITPWDDVIIDCTNLTLAQAFEQSGANFEVSLKQGYYSDGPLFNEAKDYFYIMRPGYILGQCEKRYTVIQNSILLDIAKSVPDAVLKGIGILDKGKKVFFLMQIPNLNYTVTGSDNINTYLVIVNGHDAHTSLMMGLIPVRNWCNNMLPAVGSKLMKFRHTENAEVMIENFKEKLKKQIEEYPAYIKKLKLLANTPVNKNISEVFIEIFKIKDTKQGKTKLKELENLYLNEHVLIKGTWYAVYNAITGYLNYYAGRTQSSRLKSLWFGANANISVKALEILHKECLNVSNAMSDV